MRAARRASAADPVEPCRVIVEDGDFFALTARPERHVESVGLDAGPGRLTGGHESQCTGAACGSKRIAHDLAPLLVDIRERCALEHNGEAVRSSLLEEVR